MPPKKRRQRGSPKTQLLFQQQPLEGPKRPCDSPRPPATRTVQVPSKPIDRSSIMSWVSPQFDTTAESGLPAHRKHHRQARLSSRKSACRFPQLTFEDPRPPSSQALETPLLPQGPRQPPKAVPTRKPLVPLLSPQSSEEVSSAQSLPSLPRVFLPPSIQTPEATFILPERKENTPSTCILHTATPKHPEPGPVLVEDTPEDKYGVRVTWRRRRHLLAYLAGTGRLSRSQFLVKN